MNIIEIKLCEEDRAALDLLAAAMGRLTAALEVACTPIIVDETIAEPEDYTALETAPKSPQNEDEGTEEQTTQPSNETPKEPSPAVTVDDLRSKYMTLAATEKREQARTLLKLYADKISDIPEDKRAEVLEKLTALEG